MSYIKCSFKRPKILGFFFSLTWHWHVSSTSGVSYTFLSNKYLFSVFLFVIYKWTCSSCPPFPVRIWNEVFSGGTKTWGPGGKPSETRSQSENLQETQTTCDVNSGNRTQATAVGGEHSHHCPIPAPSNIYPGITDLFIAKPNCFFFYIWDSRSRIPKPVPLLNSLCIFRRVTPNIEWYCKIIAL